MAVDDYFGMYQSPFLPGQIPTAQFGYTTTTTPANDSTAGAVTVQGIHDSIKKIEQQLGPYPPLGGINYVTLDPGVTAMMKKRGLFAAKETRKPLSPEAKERIFWLCATVMAVALPFIAGCL